MIEKIKKRFIFISMVSVSAVLIMILALINIINYSNTTNKINNEVDNFFRMPEEPFNANIDNLYLGNKNSRVSYAIIEDGEIIFNKLFDKSDDEIIKIVNKLDKKEGYVDDYYYITKDNQIFVFDFHIEKSSFRTFLYTSSTVILSSIVLIYLIILFISDKALKPFEENYKKQKEFITNVSHDLKTPLAIIMTNNEVLEMEHGDNEWNIAIKTQLKKLSKMIDDMILLSRVEEPINETALVETNIKDMIKKVILEYNEPLRKNKLKVNFIGDNLKLKVDEENFTKMINLLLDNAIKYGKENTTINVELSNKKLIIKNESNDTIDKENIKFIFDRFYRLDKSRNSKTSGSGIGLSIIKNIINNHNFKIKAYIIDDNIFTIEVNF